MVKNITFKKPCEKCECEFKFTKKEIIFDTKQERDTKEISRKQRIKTHLFSPPELDEIVTYKVKTYITQFSYIICPLCGTRNIINSNVNKELMGEQIEIKKYEVMCI